MAVDLGDLAVDLGDLVGGQVTATFGRYHRMAWLTEAQQAVICDSYERGDRVKDIASVVGCCTSTVKNTVRRHGYPPRAEGGRWSTPTEEQSRLVLQLWDEGVPLSFVSTRTGLTKGSVARVLQAKGRQPVDTRGRARREYSSNWKGGRRPAPGGYVQVLLDDDHPYVAMRMGSGYVLEHRLIMAQSLGRLLAPDETVHHIDGDRQNNDLSNLQLRFGAHGKNVAMKCCDCGSANVRPARLGGQ